MHPDSWYEHEYNPRVAVPDAAAHIAQWRAASEAAAATMAGYHDLAYGAGLNETLDLFPAPRSRSLLVFFHGGYWRALDKRDVGWIAPALVAAGVSVAIVNYALCPAVTLDTIVAQCRRATAWLYHHAPDYGVGSERMLISGHSAGGHLTAMMWTVDWASYAVPDAAIVGGVALSGVFDLAPLLHTTINAELGLDLATAAALSPLLMQPRLHAPLLLAVGARETSEFVRQSQHFSEAWGMVCAAPLLLPDCHHFTILAPFADPASAIWQTAALRACLP